MKKKNKNDDSKRVYLCFERQRYRPDSYEPCFITSSLIKALAWDKTYGRGDQGDFHQIWIMQLEKQYADDDRIEVIK